ncbi:Teneurin-2 [Streptomyces rimosus]|uniref:NHL domain-containing protein n=1 Tax=Streptomyces rimosus TaxID=1927 RepID=UPI0004D40128|nr:Teneurin-2 [Streptomyces rimosus]KEF03105.1 Teneurin-2 [Streptomyces rimosus]
MTTQNSPGSGPQPAGIAQGCIATVAGNGTAGYLSDGGPATLTQLNWPHDVALDEHGNLYIVCRSNNRVRKVTPQGIITTVAGNGIAGYVSDGGPATATQLSSPCGVAADGAGNLYIADLGNNRVRKVDTKGIITTVAGNGTGGYVSDGGPATATQLNGPHSVAVDRDGNVYIADYHNHRVRKVDSKGLSPPSPAPARPATSPTAAPLSRPSSITRPAWRWAPPGTSTSRTAPTSASAR